MNYYTFTVSCPKRGRYTQTLRLKDDYAAKIQAEAWLRDSATATWVKISPMADAILSAGPL